MEPTLAELKVNLEKAIGALKEELAKVRTGRASLTILDEARVDYYGSLVPLQQVATMGVPEPRLITIQPWESKLIPEIEKAVQKLGLGLNPVNDGKLIRIPIPSLTEERRKELVKLVKKHAEDAKVNLRMRRRDANEALKEKQKGGVLTEDELRRGQELVQKLIDDSSKKIDELLAHKEKDILSV